MSKQPHTAFSQSSLNTLAQTGTKQTGKQAVIVSGKGTEMSADKPIKGKAKRKLITQTMALSLLTIADKKQDFDRSKAYWNTYHCQSKIYSAEGRLYGKYCKNRFCTVCCSIRKAQLINKYLPVIRTWEQPYFVTLTAKAVPARSLAKRMNDMNRGFRKISSKLRKRSQRGTGIKLIGVKSLECNFNPEKKTYNPHLHLIVANKEMADILLNEWLTICTPKFASPKAQKATKVENGEKALIEIVKYGSKIFTEPDINKKAAQKGSPDIYAAALDNIFAAMKGIRIFDRFGFDLPKEEITKTSATLLSEYEEWSFDFSQTDWINVKDSSNLSGYNAPQELINLLKWKVDNVLE